MIGTSLSHFKITAKLGEGGMGEVYRAEDGKLGREVAIKVLPQAVAADPERLARFEREAKLLASLNHPNIAGIHQVEQDGETHFLVMELVEGEDLHQRLARGPIPLDEALPMAMQVAEAIESAHAQGVIHRDLKPANVKVGPDGQMKILDFGLAKALDPAATSGIGHDPSLSPLSVSPTMTAQMTQAGVILGTAAYMSPEQARGQDVDKRADIWAFGVLLFEMLAGKKSFGGKTVTDIIAAVVTRDPDWDSLPAGTPNQIRRLLVHCTRKDAHDRLHDIADARIAIREAIDKPEFEEAAVGSRRGPGWIGVAGGLVAGLILGALIWNALAPAPSTGGTVTEPTRLTIEIPDGQTVKDVAISRDGRTVLYTATSSDGEGAAGTRKLWVRPLGSSRSRLIPDTEGIDWATFSPDGRWIAYRIREAPTEPWRIRKVSVKGGPAVTVLDDSEQEFFMAGEWRDDGTMLIDQAGALVALPMDGGEPDVLLTAAQVNGESDQVLLLAHTLPDGDRVVLSLGYQTGGNLAAKTDVFSIGSGARETLLEDAGAWLLTDDAIVAWTADVMLAFPFDSERATLLGGSVPVSRSGLDMSASRNGTYVESYQGFGFALPVLLDSQGNLERIPAFADAFEDGAEARNVRWSPDGTRLALSIMDPAFRQQLFTYDVERRALSRLGFPGQFVGNLVWSPDGEQIAFSSRGDELDQRVYVRSWAGDDQPRSLLESAEGTYDEVADWSADGSTIALNRHDADSSDIVLLDVESGEVTPLVRTDAFEHSPAFSPDGRWVAFNSDEAGQAEVYVTRVGSANGDGNPRKFRGSASGGKSPQWSPDGKSLYFVAPGARLVQVDVEASEDGSAMQFGVAREVLDMDSRSLSDDNFQSWHLHPDGSSFVFLESRAEEGSSPHIQIVLGWDEEIRRLLNN